MDRREFLEASSLMAGGALLRDLGVPLAEPPMIGIQAGAVSFVDEGTSKVLDNVQQLGAVNTIFLATFTYGRGIGGRQVPGQPLPDHGKQEYDTASFRGGNFATPHPQYYKGTAIAPEKAPDHPGYDVIADVLPAAHARKMKVIAWFEDVIAGDVPGFDQAREVVVSGPPSSFACSRNPHTRHFWLGLVEDYLRSYDVDGLMWGSERQGPLGNALVANHGGAGAGGRIACFCQYCQDAARQDGVSVARAKEGYTQLANWASAIRGGPAPADGAFVTFWRLLVKYPEILAWERLWNEALNDTYRDMYRLAHEIAPAKGMGWHVWHNNSFSPFYRAEQDYAEFSQYSDFLKVVAYNLCGGERLVQYVRSVNRSLFADLTPEQVLAFTYDVQQYHDQPLDALAPSGLGADYVRRETARAIAGVGPIVKIWPGIDIDIPTGGNSKKTGPDDVAAAVAAAFAGGAHGVLLSRKYSEMRLANLAGAGRAVRNLPLLIQPREIDRRAREYLALEHHADDARRLADGRRVEVGFDDRADERRARAALLIRLRHRPDRRAPDIAEPHLDASRRRHHRLVRGHGDEYVVRMKAHADDDRQLAAPGLEQIRRLTRAEHMIAAAEPPFGLDDDAPERREELHALDRRVGRRNDVPGVEPRALRLGAAAEGDGPIGLILVHVEHEGAEPGRRREADGRQQQSSEEAHHGSHCKVSARRAMLG